MTISYSQFVKPIRTTRNKIAGEDSPPRDTQNPSDALVTLDCILRIATPTTATEPTDSGKLIMSITSTPTQLADMILN